MDYRWDHWFHIAHAREALQSNKVFPQNPYWADVPLSDMFGVWHSILAAIARVARVDILVLWRVGNAYMGALSLLGIHAVASALFRRSLPRLLAVLIFLGSSTLPLDIMRTFLYPWAISTLLLWTSLSILYRYAIEGDRIQLVSAVTIGITPAFIHPQEYLFLCFAALALGLSAFLVRAGNEFQLTRRRVWLFLLLILVLGAPVLFSKYPNRVPAAATVNTATANTADEFNLLYRHPLAHALALLFPYYFRFDALKYSLIPFPLISVLVLYLLPRNLSKSARWFLLSLTWAPILATLLPGLSHLAQLVLKETYAYRILILVPTPFIWAPIIVEVVSAMILGKRSKNAYSTRFRGPLGWAYVGLAACMVGGIALAVFLMIGRRDSISDPRSPLSYSARPAFERLDELARERAIVLSDPMTSYAVPGLTRHHVVLNEPAHGSRADMDIRFIRMRELLSSPEQPAEEAIAALEDYAVDFIVVSKIWLDHAHYMMTPFYSDYTLDFLRTNRACFEPEFESEAFEIFRYRGCSAGTLVGKNNRFPGPIVSYETEYTGSHTFARELDLVGYTVSWHAEDASAQRLVTDLVWQATDTLQEPYLVYLELLCSYPGDHLPYSKTLRRFREQMTGKLYQVEEEAWVPIPPGGLEPEDHQAQTIELELPANLAVEDCELSLYMLERTQALRDQKVLPNWLMEKQFTHPGDRLASFDRLP